MEIELDVGHEVLFFEVEVIDFYQGCANSWGGEGEAPTVEFTCEPECNYKYAEKLNDEVIKNCLEEIQGE